MFFQIVNQFGNPSSGLRLIIAEHFDQQHRLWLTIDKGGHVASRRVDDSFAENRLVQQLDGAGIVAKDLRYVAQRIDHVVEMDHGQRRRRGKRCQADLGFQQYGQRPFAAHDQVGQIPGLASRQVAPADRTRVARSVDEFVQVVARNAAHDFRIACQDFVTILLDNLLHTAVDRRLG